MATHMATKVKNVFGIDLGTTNTCIALYQNKKFEILKIDDHSTFPSLVAYDEQADNAEKKIVVGHDAEKIYQQFPHLGLRSIKRWMNEPCKELTFGPLTLNPIEVSSEILKFLKQKVWEQYELVVEDVVITVPAYFNDTARRSTLQSGKIAGLNVLGLINEPTAASLVYEYSPLHSHLLDSPAGLMMLEEGHHKKEEKWLVYDIGGGTFDVTLLKVNSMMREVLSSHGDLYLGGDEFDEELALYFCHLIKVKYHQELQPSLLQNEKFCQEMFSRLKLLAEQVKMRLSEEAEVEIDEKIHYPIDVSDEQDEQKDSFFELKLKITREQFEDFIAPYLDKTFEKIEKTLEDAHTHKEEIDKILLVGGSSKIPAIRKLIEKHFHLKPMEYVDADCSVALGAAIWAAILSGLEFERMMVDVTSYSLGIACLGEEDYQAQNNSPQPKEDDFNSQLIEEICRRHPKTFAPIIKKNSRIPAKYIDVFYTVVDNQEKIEIPIYQGESRNVRENYFVGALFYQLKPCPAGTAIYIGFEYDASGMVHIGIKQEGDKRFVSYNMDLKHSPQDNLFLTVVPPEKLTFKESKEDYEELLMDDDFSYLQEEKEGANNYLIQKVEEKLYWYKEQMDQAGEVEQHKFESEMKKIEIELRSYKNYLLMGDDERLDQIEDHLYDWINQV